MTNVLENTSHKRARKETPSLFEQVGGMAAIEQAVDLFYERVFADPELVGFFANANMKVLRKRQTQFLAQALGGPQTYKGRPMKQAHQNLAIEQKHFARVADHLTATLQSLEVAPALIDEIIGQVATLAPDIVNTSSPPADDAAGETPTRKVQPMNTAPTKTAGNKAALLQQALNGSGHLLSSIQTNIFVANVNLTIVYANERALETLRLIEPAIQKEFGLTVDEIVGGPIHRFHRDPKGVTRILRNPAALPHEASFTFGDVTLKATINSVYGVDDELLGYVVNWEDASERLKSEREFARIQAMMENAPTNVIMADTGLNITYINPAMLETFKKLEKYLPVAADQVVGQNIDIFHKVPSYQRKILSDPKNLPHRAQIQLGPETADLLVSPIYDPNGNYLGPMVTWELITDKVKLETEQARIRAMMENAPTNLIMTNTDLNITYINPAMLETFKKLEKYLPVAADQVVGQNIDIFHKVPSYQRKILSDPKNLPHRAQIQLGPETADLLVSPIYDQNGKYMGPMVTWELITEKLALENQTRVAAEREKEQAEELRMKVDSMLEVVNAAGEGDLTNDILIEGDDTIGQMAEGLRQFFEDLRGNIRTIAENAQALATSSEELTTVSQQMGANAEETSAQANVVASAAQQVSHNIQTVATGVEELTASIKEIAGNAGQAAQVARNAVRITDNTNTTIAKLGDSSKEIGNVIKVITSIAEQTNLLALNATIEAARAGEAGKGFAVVANEVKELAKETAKATEDISRKIETIQGDTRASVEAISEISTIINQINDIQDTIATAVEEQTATTSEMSRSIAEAATGSTEIAKNISSVAQAAKSTTAGVEDSQNAALELSRMSADLQIFVGKFKIERNGVDQPQSALMHQMAGVVRAAGEAPRNGKNGEMSQVMAELQKLLSHMNA